jgi:hypothetical protein
MDSIPRCEHDVRENARFNVIDVSLYTPNVDERYRPNCSSEYLADASSGVGELGGSK